MKPSFLGHSGEEPSGFCLVLVDCYLARSVSRGCGQALCTSALDTLLARTGLLANVFFSKLLIKYFLGLTSQNALRYEKFAACSKKWLHLARAAHYVLCYVCSSFNRIPIILRAKRQSKYLGSKHPRKITNDCVLIRVIKV